MENPKTVFETLYDINVSDHIERKPVGGGRTLTFVSWVWAWAEVKKLYPDAKYTVYEAANGLNYHTDGRTAYVKCGVTIKGEEIVEYLPVMTGAQRSMPLEQVTSHDVVRSIQRCVTKAIARHGLGLYVYAGEDLPETEQADREAEINEERAALLDAVAMCDDTDSLARIWNTNKAAWGGDKAFVVAVAQRGKALKGGDP